MPITQHELGRRIRAAREASGLTQEKLAQRIGLSRTAVVQIEAGNRSVSSLELDAVARVLGRDMREFLADDFTETDVLSALFRADPAVQNDPAVVEALETCVTVAREHLNLERLLGVQPPPTLVASYELPTPSTRWEAVRQGEAVARDERRRLELGIAPLPDIAELLEAQGVRTAVLDLPDDVSGLTMISREVGIVVVANRIHHVLRRRFSFAHEYAHVLLDRNRVGIVSRNSRREDLIEVRANAFAAAFLMPDMGVREFVVSLGKGGLSRGHAEVFDEVGSLTAEGRAAASTQEIQLYDVVQLAHHFGVSRSSALYRLLNLRLVSQERFEHLRALEEGGAGRTLGRLLGLPEPDHDELRNQYQHRFLGNALEAYRREEISRGKLQELASLVGINTNELDLLLESAGLAE